MSNEPRPDTDRIPCPPEVIALAEKFHEHIEEYRSGTYNETQLRQEYINPLFEKTALQRQIDATDRQINRLVYELYGLTEEEIKIVEGQYCSHNGLSRRS